MLQIPLENLNLNILKNKKYKDIDDIIIYRCVNFYNKYVTISASKNDKSRFLA
jgi:hypothetical protein